MRHIVCESIIHEAILDIPVNWNDLTRFCNAFLCDRSIFPLSFLRRGKTELRRSNLQKESYTTNLCILGLFWHVLTTGRVESEPPNVVLLTAWRAGVPVMTLDGESRLIESADGRRN